MAMTVIGNIAHRAIWWTVAGLAALSGFYWFERTMNDRISAPFATELEISNRAGQLIAFYTDHTKKTVQIPTGETVVVPHTDGALVVTTGAGVTWTYNSLNLSSPELQNDVRRGRLRLTLPLTVEPSGSLLLASGRRIEPLRAQVKQ